MKEEVIKEDIKTLLSHEFFEYTKDNLKNIDKLTALFKEGKLAIAWHKIKKGLVFIPLRKNIDDINHKKADELFDR